MYSLNLLEYTKLSIGGFSASLFVIDSEISLAIKKGVPALLIPVEFFLPKFYLEKDLKYK
jgi:hypothetical protein